MADSEKNYSSELMEKVAQLEYRARMTVDGLLSGLHKSHRRGFNVEFLEHREYYQGDDLRHVDWKVYARRDRYYVKQYEEETNLSAFLLVDASKSMEYGSGGGSEKMRTAIELAAAFAYLFTKQGDSAGLSVAGGESDRFIPPGSSRKHLHRLLSELVGITGGGEASIADNLKLLSERIPRRSVIVIFSDLLEEREPIVNSLKALRGMGAEPVVFHVLDENELEFPFTKASRFIDPETGRKIAADPVAVKQRYLKELYEFIDAYREAGKMADFDYTLADARRTPGEIVLEFLENRERRKKRVP